MWVVRNVYVWNSLIRSWVVIAYTFMPTRHKYWMIEHIHVPAKRLEAIQPCCRYITRALILLTCCLYSIVYSDEVANLCASISSLLILSVAHIISDVALSCGLAKKEYGEHKLLNRLQKTFLPEVTLFIPFMSYLQPRPPRVLPLSRFPGEPVVVIIAAYSGLP
jgi:hypothetical protein